MRFLVTVLAILSAGSVWAAEAVVRDGDTLQIADTTYRLDGIDAPEFDQMCINEHADPWACGVEARDQLAKLIGGRGGTLQGSGAGQSVQQMARRSLQRERRNRQFEPAAGTSGLCAGR
jgi:endonuclease YncB( thermonuclease family)